MVRHRLEVRRLDQRDCEGPLQANARIFAKGGVDPNLVETKTVGEEGHGPGFGAVARDGQATQRVLDQLFAVRGPGQNVGTLADQVRDLQDRSAARFS